MFSSGPPAAFSARQQASGFFGFVQKQRQL
jgi:hypothetical protein